MRIPDTLLIRGETWRVYRSDKAPARLKSRGMLAREHTLGITHFDTREIVIASGLGEEEACITLVHEILHAVYHASGDENLGPELEERIVEAIDTPLYEAIKALLKAQEVK